MSYTSLIYFRKNIISVTSLRRIRQFYIWRQKGSRRQRSTVIYKAKLCEGIMRGMLLYTNHFDTVIYGLFFPSERINH